MRPIDLITKAGYPQIQYYRLAQAESRRTLHRHKDRDCVVAYHESFLGIAFIIRTKVKFWSFLILRDGIYFGGYDYRVSNIKSKLPSLITAIEKEGIILDNTSFKALKDEILLEAI